MSDRRAWGRMGWAAKAAAAPIMFYRYVLSPLLPNSCRFAPTCSTYAMEALARHGALKGGWLTLRRVCRCHPWGGSGYDPVPPRAEEAPREQVENEGRGR